MTHTALDCFLGANDGRNSSNDLFGHGLILDKSELIAQRLSAQPKGNSMKYAKLGPLEFVPFEYSEVTLENIKRDCKVIYQSPSKDHFVLGWIKFQVSKIIYVRFIIPGSGKSIPSETLDVDPFPSQPEHKKMRKNVISHSVVSPVSTAKSIASSVMPKSLSAVDMLKFGKLIKPAEKKILNVAVENFGIKSKE